MSGQTWKSKLRQNSLLSVNVLRRGFPDRVPARGAVARLAHVVDYLFYLTYGLLALRLFLALVGARSGAGFVKFIQGVTEPLYLPFKGIVVSPSLEGGYTLAVPLIVAILVYAMLHVAVRGLLRLVVQRKTEI